MTVPSFRSQAQVRAERTRRKEARHLSVTIEVSGVGSLREKQKMLIFWVNKFDVLDYVSWNLLTADAQYFPSSLVSKR